MILKSIRSKVKTSLAVVGFGTSLYGAYQINDFMKHGVSSNKKGGTKKKNILVLPFHRMKIVEQKKNHQ